MRELLEAGVHFGHQTRRWNPKMRRYIFAERGGIYIIDLQKTLELLEEAHDFARNVAERRGTMLFVGTKKQAQDAVRDHATRVGMPYVSNRWLGGLLTNWRTISERIAYLHDLRRLQTEGQLELLPSKERISLTGELEKLEANLGGVADMKRQPDAVFVIDLKKEQLAVREARRLGVPIVGLVDTNADPDEADFVIPGNDDAIRASNLIAKVVADGIAAGQAQVTPAEFTAPASDETTTGAEVEDEADAETAPAAEPEPAAQAAERAPSSSDRLGGRDSMSTTISAGLVKELRDRTGAGMMDCKRALEETEGDLEAARTLLRERGMASAGKRAGRSTTEGLVGYIVEGLVGSIAGIGCETEPVSNNEEFQAFAERVLRAVHAEGRAAVERFDEERMELAGKLGENIVVVDAMRFDAPAGNVVAGYAHPPANKIGVLVELQGGSPELARQVAMHISFAAPEWNMRDDVPGEAVEAERAIFLNSDEVQSKPEPAREKIVDGMLQKRFFAATPGGVLAEQAWIHDASKTVGQALDEGSASVVRFARVSVTG